PPRQRRPRLVLAARPPPPLADPVPAPVGGRLPPPAPGPRPAVVVDDDARALLRHEQRDLPADAAAGPRDHDRLALQRHGASLPDPSEKRSTPYHTASSLAGARGPPRPVRRAYCRAARRASSEATEAAPNTNTMQV